MNASKGETWKRGMNHYDAYYLSYTFHCCRVVTYAKFVKSLDTMLESGYIVISIRLNLQMILAECAGR